MSWSLGMQVSKLSQVLALSWVLLVASVALSTLLQVAVAPRSLVGYVTAGATPVWLLGSFAVLSLLSRARLPNTVPAVDVDQDHDAGQAGEPASKRERVRAAYAALQAAGEPVTGARLAEAAGVSPSYGRALLAEFQADPAAAAEGNGARPEGRAEP
jgi:hypothetical protein